MKTPFRIAVPQSTLDDLRDRLRRSRLPLDVDNDDWRYGTNRRYLEELLAHWLEAYDWRTHEVAMNGLAHYRTEIDGVPIHFVHEPGRGPRPIPLVLSHGWPWTFWDFRKVIGPLADPAAHGGDPADSFDVIVPSLPGFGFSTPLQRTGIEFARTAELWVTLMRDVLGYGRFAAHGGDWGSLVTAQLGHRYAEHLLGIHLGLCFPLDFFSRGLPTEAEYPEAEKHRFHHTVKRFEVATSHVAVQTTDPQTLAYALEDSPLGLCAWILERRRNWSDCNGDVETRFSKDDLLTTVMIYWVTGSIVSSMRYYWEARRHLWQPSHERMPRVEAPTAISLWPQELAHMPTPFMQGYYNLQQLTEMPSGGHFHPMEEPERLVADLRNFFRRFR